MNMINCYKRRIFMNNTINKITSATIASIKPEPLLILFTSKPMSKLIAQPDTNLIIPCSKEKLNGNRVGDSFVKCGAKHAFECRLYPSQ